MVNEFKPAWFLRRVKKAVKWATANLHAILQASYDKLHSEVPKYKMITPSVLSDRLRVSFLGWSSY